MPRVKLFDEEKALGEALDLFWEKGYEATSLSDLTDHLGIGKGSFYATFGSKRKLFDQCLAAYRSSGFEALDAMLAEKSDPIEGIRSMLDMQVEMMLSDDTQRGCFIGNSTVELADDVEIRAFLQEHNQMVKSKLVAYLRDRSFPRDAEVAADLVLTYITGISVMSKIIREPERFRLSNKLFMKSFEE